MSSASSEHDFETGDAPSCPDSARSKIRKSRKRRDATQIGHQRYAEDACLADNEMGRRPFGDDLSETTDLSYQSVHEMPVIKEPLLAVVRTKNKSFSDFQVREIERRNSILMNRIISYNRKPSQYRCEPVYLNKISNSQVNRKKKQSQIERENMILLRKIQNVKPFGLSKRK